jgi:hypothetical protein
MRRFLVAVAAVLALAGAVPLHADALSGCAIGYNDWTAWTRCSYGTGHVRVAASIINQTTRATKTIFGPWVSRGSTSLVAVPTGWLVFQVGPRLAA